MIRLEVSAVSRITNYPHVWRGTTGVKNGDFLQKERDQISRADIVE